MNKLSLNQKLNVIGVRLATTPDKVSKKIWVGIEETLYEASLEVENDSRIFMLLCSWIKYHGEHVVVEKLMKLQKEGESKWLVALAVYATEQKYHKWKSLVKKITGKHALSTIAIAEQAISFKGEEPSFYKHGFLIAKGSIRTRASDVATKQKLIKENLQYRNRFLYGANWRSDIITAIEMGYENPYRIKKATGCSYPSAYKVFNDYELVSGFVSIQRNLTKV